MKKKLLNRNKKGQGFSKILNDLKQNCKKSDYTTMYYEIVLKIYLSFIFYRNREK